MTTQDYKNEFIRMTSEEEVDPEQAYGEMIAKYGDADDLWDILEAGGSTAEWDAFQDWYENLYTGL